MQRSRGFPPVARRDARVLILGSLPGRHSLQQYEYYAHPQNAFWRIMEGLFGISGSYAQRCEGLVENRVALWDVLGASVRPGSLDADIRVETATSNDFEGFLTDHADIERVLFNGKKAQELYRRLLPEGAATAIPQLSMPSTSPAFAAMSFDAKLALWQDGLSILLPGIRYG